LLLIHSPFGGRIVETWDALLKLQQDGFIKTVGVSNFGVKHLEALHKNARQMPVVNQIEMHPLIFQERRELLEYCKEKHIAVTAYGSIFFGDMAKMEDETIKHIADAHRVTPAQVLLPPHTYVLPGLPDC
jgi:diketogulonate reductase-like aldo/keto reductase